MIVKTLLNLNWKDSPDDRFDWHRPSVFLSDHDTAWRVTGTRVMTHDTWQSPEPSPGHYTPHLPSSPTDDPRIVDSRLARISSLLSGPGWLRCRMMSPGCHMSDMSHCDRPLSRNYVKCPDKNPSWGARESRDPGGDGGVTEVTGLSVTVITESQCGHWDQHLPGSLFIILICAVLGQNPPSCEPGHCERNNWVTFSSAVS